MVCWNQHYFRRTGVCDADSALLKISGLPLLLVFFTWQSLYLYRFLTPLPLSDESAELGIGFESNCNLEKERTGGLDEGGEREKSEDWKEEVGENNQCQMRRFSVVLLWRRFETSCQDQHPAEHLSESLYNMSCRHPSHHLQVLACHPRYQDLVHHMISHQSTQWRMSHGEISAHKLPQMMIRVASHEERAYHANSYMRTVWYDQTIALYGMVHMVSRQLTCPKLPQPSHITVTR